MIFLSLILLLFSYNAKAAGPLCDTIFRSSNIGCEDTANSNSSGGSYPLLFDAFNFNPSALPTFSTPFGVEAYLNQGKVNFALIKGTQVMGLGASAKQSNATFFSGTENSKVAMENTNPSFRSSSLDKFINLGTAVNFLKIPNVGSLPFGLGYKYNPETKKWSLTPGMEIRTSILSLGVSFNREKADKYFDGFYEVQDERDNVDLNAGLKIYKLLLGYSLAYQKNTTNYYQAQASTITSRSSYTIATHISSATLVTDNMSFTAAYRKQNDSRMQSAYYNNVTSTYKNAHTLLGAAYKTQHLELGAFYNYVLDNDVSAVAKIFF